MPRLVNFDDLDSWRKDVSILDQNKDLVVTTCGGTGCQASRSGAVASSLKKALKEQGLDEKVRLRITGCQGFCEQGPIVTVEPGGMFYCHVKAEDAADIVSETVLQNKAVERLLYVDPVSQERVATEAEIPFFKGQERRILSMNRQVDPTRIEDYIAAGGYSALAKTLSGLSPEDVISEISTSGLRGRGGGGFPTGQKWESCRKAPGDIRYVICNADEGDPGAFMDRSILEGNPHLVLEGMIIGAWAIDASEGYIYVRHEYPLAKLNISKAVARAREFGLLGQNILNSGLSFDVEIATGGGAFVCGESTALMASIEGKVGEPSPKDIHTVEQGLWDRPSNLNNVETWANVPLIINNGSAWFAGKGTENSKGTKIFALTGRVKNTGLVEVAMGTPLKEIIYDMGGGASNGTAVKAVQTGGPSGGCIPASLFDLPVDFETLTKAGSMVGSGGMVVMDEQTCMVDVAKYFLEFLQDESCGKCVPCRVGIDRMLEIINDITQGRGKLEQIDLLEDLANTVGQTSLCALGKTAPNPVLSTLLHFKDEYYAHIVDKKCPAGVCRELIKFSIDEEKCTGCGACKSGCPTGAVTGEKKKPHQIDPETCSRCGICRTECKFDAITVQ